jgi:Domain of unknown function (DUF1844)
VAQAPDEGFKVTDRRRRDEAGGPAPANEPPQAETEGVPTPPSGAHTRDERSLVGLFMMLGSEALIALGEEPDPVTGQKHRELTHTSNVIDVLSLLRDKTEGHRSAEETQTLDTLIYDLQLRYVKAVKSSG